MYSKQDLTALRKAVKCLEQRRLYECYNQDVAWLKWGPYLSERQWGTVREDRSAHGDAWNDFSHDQARSRVYRWGEDGIAGISDDKQLICFAPAFWNGKDPILKERLFGLTNSEGNHGEDVKECYHHLDNTPTHSYMKYLYKYPHEAFPYDLLVRANHERTRQEREYELEDTGIFKNNRFFDIEIEYAKAGVDDILIKITAHNRSADESSIDLLPTIWFRNIWADGMPDIKPRIWKESGNCLALNHPLAGNYNLYFLQNDAVLFTDNESNLLRLVGLHGGAKYVKDAFHTYIIKGDERAVNSDGFGTKAAVHFHKTIAGHKSASVTLRLCREKREDAFCDFDAIFKKRKHEADAFYKAIAPQGLSDDTFRVYKQSLSGMLWNKQFYYFDLDRWLLEREVHPIMNRDAKPTRNGEWYHLKCADVISMPDKWEYPWFAAWDLAFHTLSFALVDVEFAKRQLLLLLSPLYQNSNGQIPAYEWNFSDVNPPVHAWATLFLFKSQVKQSGVKDYAFLERSYQGLMQNFNWWLNRKDPQGKSVFAGGFLGLDNIGVFDRSAQLPEGGTLEQADGTAWMAFYCQNMIEMALILAERDSVYEERAFRLLQHFVHITYAMDRIGNNVDEMWDEEDGFYYDLFSLPNGNTFRLKTRSIVGLLPLCASTVFEADVMERFPRFGALLNEFKERHIELFNHIAPLDKSFMGEEGRRLLSVVNKRKLQRILGYMLDENEFLSPYGIRSLSKVYKDQPFSIALGKEVHKVAYLPGESDSGMFGGNSNWRGPVWMPINVLIIRALLTMHHFYGDDFKVACPTGSQNFISLYEVAQELSSRLSHLFIKDDAGRRPVFGESKLYQTNKHWRDNLLFYEYFDGDTGEGLGASHQTGWTGNIAALLQLFG